MRGLGRLVALLAGFWLATAAPAAFAQTVASPFQDWSAVVVAGDWHAHDGGPSEAFDNARRDVSRALERIGFASANLWQLSVRPDRYRDARPGKSSPEAVYTSLVDLTAKAGGGCLVYFTSHGAPQGVVVDEQLLTPGILGSILDHTCGQRPTVVVVSACFSGVFIPALAGPNRMVLTAARPDRTSFGCGQTDKYPYFDDCFLSSIGGAHDFPALGRTVQACVAAREIKEGMRPPSEPQLWIGAALKPLLPLYVFTTQASR